MSRKPAKRVSAFRPNLVCLEDRSTPANFTVTSVADSGAGTLRQAIIDASATTNEDSTIGFDLAIAGQKITLLSPLDVTATKTISISSPVAGTILGNNSTQLLIVQPTATVNLSGFTFFGGKGTDGGAIVNKGTLNLNGMQFFNNQATNDGGAILNIGTLKTIDTVFSNNTAGNNGGAIAVIGSTAVLNLNQSTVGKTIDRADSTKFINGNTAVNGGGVYIDTASKAFFINSTVNVNTATGVGSGVQNLSTQSVLFTNSTVAFNVGVGINTGTGANTILNNTIVIGNTAGDITGDTVGVSKNNLIGDATKAGGLNNGENGNIVGIADPKTVIGDLLQLTTDLYSPVKGSPAIDKGNNALAVDATGAKLTSDQNAGTDRISNTTVDIGSREFILVPPVSVAGLNASTIAQQDKLLTGAFTNVVITSDTTTTPLLITFTATKGTFNIPGTISGVTNITGSGTSTITFTTVTDGGALGAVAVIDYAPPAGVSFPESAGEKITVTAKNTVTNDTQTQTSALSIIAPNTPPLTPLGFSTVTPVNTIRPVTLLIDPARKDVRGFQVSNITNGKLFVENTAKTEIKDGQVIALPADANGNPTTDRVTIYFAPNNDFVGTMSFVAKSSTTADGATGTLFSTNGFTTNVQVVSATTPYVLPDNPGIAPFVNGLSAGQTSYIFTVNYADAVGIDTAKLGTGDITVTSRAGGAPILATFLGSTPSDKSVTATYAITPPNGKWSTGDKGSFVISLNANRLFSTSGSSAPAQDTDTFDVNVNADPAGIPQAKLAAAAVDSTATGKTQYNFTVTYTDNVGIDASTINTKDLIVVLGPKGFAQSATFVSVDKAGNVGPLVATYSLTPPDGDWDSSDTGLYSVLMFGSVKNTATAAATVTSGSLGTFNVNIPAAGDTTPPTVALGSAVNITDTNKANAYNFTVVYSDNAAVDASTFGDKNVRITGPNNFNTLANLVSVDKTGNGTPRTVTYQITSPGGFTSAANGKYTIGIEPNQVKDTAGNLLAPNANLGTFTINVSPPDTTAPTATIGTALAVGNTSTPNLYTFTVTYADNVAINASSIDSKDIQVTGPNGFSSLATFVSLDTTGNGTPRTATYSIVPPGGAWAISANGTYTIALLANQVTDTSGNAVAAANLGTFTVALTSPNNPLLVGSPQYVVGTDAGVAGKVQFYNPDKSARLIDPLAPFGNFTGGIRTAAADFNGDGVPDIVVGTGPGIATQAIIYDGANQKQLFTINPFEAAFQGGIYVAVGDINGDGTPDLVISPDQGGGPRLRVFTGKDFTQIADFFGINDPNFRGGARAAIGDFNADGKGDIVVAAGFGGGPRISVIDGSKLTSNGGPTLFGDFFAFEETLRNGTFVSAGDINGDGKADLIVGAGPGGGPRVSVFDSADLLNNKQTRIADFFAGDNASRGGVRVVVKNLDGDNLADVVTGSGSGAGNALTAYTGKTLSTGGQTAMYNFDTFPGTTGGIFVG